MASDTNPIELFYSYAHEDETYRVQLENHLAGMRRAGVIGTWDDRKITAGSNWSAAIRERLERANIILCLLSSDFTASEYAVKVELARALEREREGKARVIGILVRPVAMRYLPLSQTQLLPRNAQAIELWKPMDLGFVDVVEQLQVVIEELKQQAIEHQSREHPAFTAPAPPPTQHAWSVPKRNRDFVGREQEFERLHTILGNAASPAVAAVVGEAGVGKSQMSFEYAYRHEGDYDVAWTIRAERTESIAADLSALAAQLNIVGESSGRESEHPSAPRARRSAPLPNAESQVVTVSAGTGDAAVDALMSWLGEKGRWLLIFDNAASLASVSSYIPKRGSGHVVITSRNDALPDEQSVRLQPFRQREAVQFLVERAEDASAGARAEAEKLVSSLGSVPLALEYAASFVSSSDKSLADYLVLIENAVPTKAALDDPTTRIAATWEVSLDKLGHGSPAALLFGVCAWLAPDDIPRSMFGAGLAWLGEELRAVVAEPLEFSNAIAQLLRLAIVRVRGDSFSTHRAMQEAVRNRLPAEERPNAIANVVRLLHGVYPNADAIPDSQSWEECERYLPHAVTIANHAMSPSDDPKSAPVEPELVGHLLWRVGDYQFEQARFLEAKSTLDRALSAALSAGLKHSLVADIHNSLGNVLLDWRGDYDNAKREYEEAFKVDQAIGADRTHDAAIHLNNVGFVLEQQGQLQLALTYYKRALEIEIEQHELVEASKTMLNIGSISETLGNMAEAEKLYDKAIEIQRNDGDVEPNELADGLSAMGTLKLDTGNARSARTHLEEALTRYQSVHGTNNHPDIARSLVNLARVSLAEGNTDAARGSVDNAIVMYRAVFGDGALNPSLGAAYYALGEIQERERNLEGAKTAYESALNNDDQRGNATSLGVAEDLEAIGRVLENLGRRDDALGKYEHALRLYVNAYGPDHPYSRSMAQKRDAIKARG